MRLLSLLSLVGADLMKVGKVGCDSIVVSSSFKVPSQSYLRLRTIYVLPSSIRFGYSFGQRKVKMMVVSLHTSLSLNTLCIFFYYKRQSSIKDDFSKQAEPTYFCL